MENSFQKLQDAEAKAAILFNEIEKRNIIKPFETEASINDAIFDLAHELFGIQKYWHKRIVRAGENTLHPYDENPPNLTLQPDDILFLDFGPIFEDWEADFGRTYVLGNDPDKHRLKADVETSWYEIKTWFDAQKNISGAELYAYVQQKATDKGWELGGEIAGHLSGHFPHEKLPKGQKHLYIHPENFNDLRDLDAKGQPRHWILEIHFIDADKKIGGFFEQLFF
ncbi:MAG: M24 family metallopeptidase [Flavobacterium sp.]